jgi:uncharacterized protein (UPF0548 family)
VAAELLKKTGIGLGLLDGEQRQEWERLRWERDNASAARLERRRVSDIEDDAGTA